MLASADVRISEIAWMGSADGSTQEWIELENTESASVSLDGWMIQALDDTPHIMLSGQISGFGRYLIERTDDDSVPHVAADLVASFGSGLENGGETLMILDASGTERDRVVGEDAWSGVGGDNTSKMTPQRIDMTWVTATPTPRAAPVPPSDQSSDSSEEQVLGASTPSPTPPPSSRVSTGVVSIYPRATITVRAGLDQSAFVGLPVLFLGSSTGLYDETLPNATYRWNFGDGATSEGMQVSHTYGYAGEYVVTLEVFHAGHVAQDRVLVRVEEPTLSVQVIGEGTQQAIRIASKVTREMDMSGFVLRDTYSPRYFTLPRHTVLLPGRTLTIPTSVSGLSNVSSVILTHQDQVVLAASAPLSLVPPSSSPKADHAGVSRPVPLHTSTMPVRVAPLPNPTPHVEADATPSSTVLYVRSGAGTSSTSGIMAAIASTTDSPLFLSLFALLLMAVAGYLVWRERGPEPTIADEYAIIEDIIEGKDDLDTRS